MRDDTRPGRPALRAGDRQPVPPAMLAAAQPGGAALSPLDSADASFRALTTGPQPLALHAASARRRPAGPAGARWMSCGCCCCTRRPAPAPATRCGPSWSAAPAPGPRPGPSAWPASPCPGLRRAAAHPGRRLPRRSRRPAGRGPDRVPGRHARPGPRRPGAVSRWRPGCAGPPGGPGRQLAYADAGYAARRRDLRRLARRPGPALGPPGLRPGRRRPPRRPDPRPRPQLIGRNRLEGVPLSQIAAETGISHTALCNRRKRAEKAITDAIRGGLPRRIPEMAAREKRRRKPDFC